MASVDFGSVGGRYLFVDGLESDWDSVNKWIDLLSEKCPELDKSLCDRFSYFETDQPYDTHHTLSHLDRHVDRFIAYLAGTPARITPVGFSLGAVISILGASRAIDAGRSIARLVLVAPATTPSERLYRAYRIMRSGDVPEVIEEMCGEAKERRTEVKKAFGHLLNHGVVVEVIFAPDDDYCPFVWPCVNSPADIDKLSEHVVDVPRPRGKRVDFHVGLRTDPDILAALCGALTGRVDVHS